MRRLDFSLFAIFTLFALLIGDTAGSFARGLTGGLTFTATAFLRGYCKISRFQCGYPFHAYTFFPVVSYFIYYIVFHKNVKKGRNVYFALKSFTNHTIIEREHCSFRCRGTPALGRETTTEKCGRCCCFALHYCYFH